MSVITIFSKLYKKEDILPEDIENAIQYCPPSDKKKIRENLKTIIDNIINSKEKSEQDHKNDEDRIKAKLLELGFPEKNFNFKDCALLIEYLKLENAINDFGELEEEAILLISLFGNLEQSIEYLVKHAKNHPGMKLDLYDALHFARPMTRDWDPTLWGSLAQKNMPSKLFMKVFAHADKIERFLKNDLEKYLKDKSTSVVGTEILKNLTDTKIKEIETEKVFTSLDEYLEFKVNKSKSSLEKNVEKAMEYWVKEKLNIDTRKKPSIDEAKSMKEFQKTTEYQEQKKRVEVQEFNKFEETSINEYINLQAHETKKQIEAKIQESLFTMVDSHEAKKVTELNQTIEILEQKIASIEGLAKKPSSSTLVASASERNTQEKPQQLKLVTSENKTMTEQLQQLKAERSHLKKQRDEFRKSLLNKTKVFEDTVLSRDKKRALIRTVLSELLPPNKVLSDHVTIRLAKEKSNLQNAYEMQMAKIYVFPEKKTSQDEGSKLSIQVRGSKLSSQDAGLPTISPNIELPFLYELGKKCAYRFSDHNKRAALKFYEQGISEKGFNAYLKWTPQDDKASMPDVFIDLADIGYPGYYLKRLDKDDPQIATAGRETSCCQHVDGAGKSSAKHAVVDPNGALYALFARSEHSFGRNISPEDVMVAQSWAWRGKKNTTSGDRDFVFDSIESHLNFRVKNQALMCDAYTYLGHKLISETNDIRRVIVGKGRYANTPARMGSLPLEKNEMAIFSGSDDIYRDSTLYQSIIASKDFPYIHMYISQNPDVPRAFVEAVQQKMAIFDEKSKEFSNNFEKFKFLIQNDKQFAIDFLFKFIKEKNYHYFEYYYPFILKTSQNKIKDIEILKILTKLLKLNESQALAEPITVNEIDQLMREGSEILKNIIKQHPEISYQIFKNMLNIRSDFAEDESNEKREQKKNALSIMRYLIKLGFNPRDSEDYFIHSVNYDTNPIQTAIYNRFPEMALLLIEEGFPVHRALFDLAMELGLTNVVEGMLKYAKPPIDLNEKIGSETLLSQAINLYKSTEIATILLKYGANPNVLKQPTVQEARNRVTESSEPNQYESLPTYDPYVTYSYTEITSPYEPVPTDDPYANPEDMTNTVHVNKEPSDPNTLEALGDTPLMLAIRKNDMPLFTALIEAKADLSLKNNREQTAIMIAELLKREEMVSILKKVEFSLEKQKTFTPTRDMLKSRQTILKDEDSSNRDQLKPD